MSHRLHVTDRCDPPQLAFDGELRPIDVPRLEGIVSDERVSTVVWCFVAFGVAIRLTRFLLKPPLWGDEAFVAANFIDRGYLDMLRPLEYHQVCPLLFMWMELSVVRLLGFSEWTLRLVPTVLSIGSLFLFRHLAMRLLRGVPLLLAVGIFAVAYYPIRHGNEVKPYASDLFAALVLITLAVEWCRAPQRLGWLWALTLVMPIAVSVSYPAVFVGGAMTLALFSRVWRQRRATTLAAFGAMNVAMVGTFLTLFVVFTGQQYEREFAASMQLCWQDSFPPLERPLKLLGWLLEIHTGRMLAYPVGGSDGGSTLTMLCLGIGATVLWRRGQRGVLAMLLLPFALTFVAAALQRYPYGGSARIMQFVAPSICLLAALGAAALIAQLRKETARTRGVALALGTLAAIGLASLTRDVVKPYKTIFDANDRAFAAWLWREKAHDAELVCVYADQGRELFEDCFEWGQSALYRCNQRIHSQRHRAGRPPAWDKISAEHPLRCVVYGSPQYDRDDQAFAAWETDMSKLYKLIRQECHTVNTDSPSHCEYYEIYEFAPREERLAAKEGATRQASKQSRSGRGPG